MKSIGKILVLSTSLLVGSASIPVTPLTVLQAEAAAVTKINKTTYQTIANLNLRSGAGTKYKVLITIPKGKLVTATERIGSWYKVSYTYSSKEKNYTKTGWVSVSFLKTYKPVNKSSVIKSSSGTISKQSTAASSSKISKTHYQTTTRIHMRSGAGTNYKIVKTLPKYAIVSSTERKGSWQKVYYTYTSKGKRVTTGGWISKSYLKEYYRYYKTKTTYYYTKKTTGIYATPDTKKKAISSIGSNNVFYSSQKVINSLGQTWLRVSYKGKVAYLPSGNVFLTSVKTFGKTNYITDKDTFLYASYGNIHSKLTSVPKSSIVSSGLIVGNWLRLSYGGKAGYIHISDLDRYYGAVNQNQNEANQPPVITETPISGKLFVTTASLNLRQAANTESSILTVLPGGAFYYPTHKVSNGWVKVTANGVSGYVSGDYFKEVTTGDPFHRNGYQFIDLRKPSKVTSAQIDSYINNYLGSKASVLKGKGQAIINAGNKYGVNALYLAAHAILESGYGTSNISLGKKNLFGFGAYDAAPFVGAVRFSTIEQNIEYIAQEMKASYLNPNSWKYNGAYLGFSTKTVYGNTRINSNSEGMNFYYASDPKWGQKIAAHMQRILPYNNNDYDNAAVDTRMFDYPSRPAGADVFPAGIKAVANKDIKLTTQKGSTVVAITLKKGTLFDISEKHNDYWIKIKFNNKDYWTKDIQFDKYKDYLSVKNLGRVTVSSLNIRPTASTSQAAIGTFYLNQYVHLVLDTAGNPTMDGSKTWYKVKLADGRIGWVSKQSKYEQYIIQELK
ncbi:SH3 domain-containing protein [Mesobacillus jeotgali]|uniref:SH3 domain-containing protein n=1 Tax=Mesobacillus jeotgali TaxID=129985 RepID=UPI0009A60FCD|nr:SH3 domain-containing protein [Mesobacillus jeotgali]